MSKVMIIEDNENLKNELIQFLLMYGYEAYSTDDYKNIVDTILKDEPDLILLDINLLARIGSLLRRTGMGKAQDILEHNGLKLNMNKGEVTYKDKNSDLSKNEFKILACLMKNKESIVGREDLMDYLWNSDLFIDDNTLSVNVTRLRKKLDDLGFKNAIETKRGIGYILK
ncbi:winged helix-turn-helix domain-containing protein [uncultured Clostridium sp.]|uniref:winged helix-turn-helix domain-containing protein n=1 Tax=uncultured Clostridium sp. TaxID=59620 RepID=UPI0025FDA1FC|nr:winged helix-turn-helix domain-containing protein [uncultured Clostridium sp.]